MVFRFVIKKSPLPRKAHLDASEYLEHWGSSRIDQCRQVGSRETSTFCCVPSSRSLLGRSISRQSKDDGCAFSYRCHILHSRDCVWHILEIRPPNGQDPSKQRYGGWQAPYHHVKTATTSFECSIIYHGEEHCQIVVEVHWI